MTDHWPTTLTVPCPQTFVMQLAAHRLRISVMDDHVELTALDGRFAITTEHPSVVKVRVEEF